jgi:CubicO group peptidase (beta-lactamase class C family)
MTLMEYSGGGVTLMQQALSDARRRPFADILRDDVLRPLGMTRSSYQQPITQEHDRNAARAHSREGKAMGPKWHVYPELAAAGLWTTPSDLARFAIEVQLASAGKSERVLNRGMVREMLTPVGVGDFAVGFSIAKTGQGWYFSHGGSNWGFRATLLAHMANGYGLAIMTNADQGGAVMAELTRRIQAAYQWDAVADPAPRGYRPPVERPEVAVAPEILARYVGEYALAAGVSLVMSIESGTLRGQPTGQQQMVLVAESDDTFNVRGVGVQIAFVRDAAGTVTGLVLRQGSSQRTAQKVK